MAVRAITYRSIMHLDGLCGIETGVRIRYADHITLGAGSYVDEGVYLHACPNGITIGPRTYVMHHAELHVYNFRDMPHSGITVGADSLIGEFNVLRGQGGITIGDRVYFAPLVQVLAVNHVFDDPAVPFTQQGITAEGIVVGNDVWVGAGAVLCDGITVGDGSVVAAGAVVTANVEPHTVVGGVPARTLREISTDQARQQVAAAVSRPIWHAQAVGA